MFVQKILYRFSCVMSIVLMASSLSLVGMAGEHGDLKRSGFTVLNEPARDLLAEGTQAHLHERAQARQADDREQHVEPVQAAEKSRLATSRKCARECCFCCILVWCPLCCLPSTN